MSLEVRPITRILARIHMRHPAEVAMDVSVSNRYDAKLNNTVKTVGPAFRGIEKVAEKLCE
jgi:hypothetical protein